MQIIHHLPLSNKVRCVSTSAIFSISGSLNEIRSILPLRITQELIKKHIIINLSIYKVFFIFFLFINPIKGKEYTLNHPNIVIIYKLAIIPIFFGSNFLAHLIL